MFCDNDRCWDGVNVDSADHKSHVSKYMHPEFYVPTDAKAFLNTPPPAYPVGGTFEQNSPCPDTHPVKLPQLFYEIVWDTREFNDQGDWPEDGSQPFVFSFGDTTGYGQHGDYMFGWEGDALQRAMDDNCNVDCPTLKSQDRSTANQCTIARRVDEEIDSGES